MIRAPRSPAIRRCGPHGRAPVRACWGGAAALALIPTFPAAEEVAIDVPSGQPVALFEVLMDDTPGQLWARFRFVAPRIGGDAGRVSYDVTMLDMDWTCDNVVLPYLAETRLEPERVVISFSDRMLPFGETAHEAAQFFEFYRPARTGCIWVEY
ncbi:DUF6497 family protein [Chachezhania antarctica]|uniref:DUF6497 family protein n=1 Tax=Chachezhania antarctica TaxID=2340860 RepID=UPI001F0946AC|nr:DUF6497 family protein [Chachezhania antarctica]|tara:strand:+ start:660 stop:1121 length:462 start_codon:yes stop_codon:yes gene_type:complete